VVKKKKGRRERKKSIRVFFRLPSDIVERIDGYAERFCTDRSAILAMATLIGLRQVENLLDPQRLMEAVFSYIESHPQVISQLMPVFEEMDKLYDQKVKETAEKVMDEIKRGT